jgi:mitogen-activated protein kinase kinase kinase
LDQPLLTKYLDILLDHNGVIKYVDFGAARVVKKTQKTMVADPHNSGGPQARAPGKQKSLAGTPMYMSPEVITGAELKDSPVVDIWSVGCVVLEMATGRRPWASVDNEWAIMYNIAQGNTPQLPAKDQLSEPGINFLQRCFHRDPKKRATAVELLQTRWILNIREQLALGQGGDETATPGSDGGGSGGGGSAAGSRQNSSTG